MRNALIVNERRGRLAEADTAAFLRGLSRLRVTLDRAPQEAEVMTLSRKHRLTVRDASYLELERIPSDLTRKGFPDAVEI